MVHIDFNRINTETPNELKKDLLKILKKNKDELELDIEIGESLAQAFEDIIIGSYRKYKSEVAILIDEYDKPIINHLSLIHI